MYKEVIRKWTLGTSSGPDDPENYADWERRYPENFSRYSN